MPTVDIKTLHTPANIAGFCEVKKKNETKIKSSDLPPTPFM